MYWKIWYFPYTSISIFILVSYDIDVKSNVEIVIKSERQGVKPI